MNAKSAPADALRALAIQTVQWDPARNALKRGAHRYAAARGRIMERRGTLPEIANVYAASSPKSGSQWMKAVFDHPIVRAHSRLFTLPQIDYQSHPERGVPLATFVPGLYLSYPEYRRIPHRHPHRVVYMFRDPRDIVVSGYFSAIGTHRNTQDPENEAARQRMRELPQSEGLRFAVDQAALRIQEMATWLDLDDPDVATFRLEDNAVDPRGQLDRMLRHTGVILTAEELTALENDVSREALQRKDLETRAPGDEGHYRKTRKTHRELFTDEHYAAIEAVSPGLAKRLGYPD